MQTALIHIGNNKNILEFSKAFSSALFDKGDMVTLVDGILDKPRMGFFQYIIFFIESPSFLGKNYINELMLFFKNAGRINAKYASVFTNKAFSSDKYLLKYIIKIEQEGLILHETKIVKDINEAKSIASLFNPIRPGE